MRIGELAEASGTTAKTLRFYEEQGLLPAAERTPAGYRDYTPDAVGRIEANETESRFACIAVIGAVAVGNFAGAGRLIATRGQALFAYRILRIDNGNT